MKYFIRKHILQEYIHFEHIQEKKIKGNSFIILILNGKYFIKGSKNASLDSIYPQYHRKDVLFIQ